MSIGASSSLLRTPLFREGKVWVAENNSSLTQESRIPFGVEEIDALTGGLSFGALHEWSGELQAPPFLILGNIIKNAVPIAPAKQLILWIGKKCWPSAYVLEHLLCDSGFSWRERSLFIDPRSDNHRLLATQSALASQSVLAVVVDGEKLSLIASRRLQLAAKQGNSLALIFRPKNELSFNSCAHSKWLVSPFASPDTADSVMPLQWKIELLRARGIATPLSWLLQWDYEQKNSLSILPDTERRPAQDREEKKSAFG